MLAVHNPMLQFNGFNVSFMRRVNNRLVHNVIKTVKENCFGPIPAEQKVKNTLIDKKRLNKIAVINVEIITLVDLLQYRFVANGDGRS